jgi:hypothetical protein
MYLRTHKRYLRTRERYLRTRWRCLRTRRWLRTRFWENSFVLKQRKWWYVTENCIMWSFMIYILLGTCCFNGDQTKACSTHINSNWFGSDGWLSGCYPGDLGSIPTILCQICGAHNSAETDFHLELCCWCQYLASSASPSFQHLSLTQYEYSKWYCL